MKKVDPVASRQWTSEAAVSQPLDTATWRRVRLLAVAVGVAFLGLAAWLVDLQWRRHGEFAALVNHQRTGQVPLQARPGDIVDRYGRLLATSVEVDSLYADPFQIKFPWHVSRQLGPVLGMDPAELESLLRRKENKRFVWLKRRVDPAVVRAVESLQLPAGWVGTVKEFKRVYPNGRLASHVLGLRDIDGQGQDGLEKTGDVYLRGQDGRRVTVRDSRGQVLCIKWEDSREPIHGKTLVTTLDITIQHFVESVLEETMTEWKPKSATAIVMEVGTGQVLALANRPTFDPNGVGQTDPDAWRNRAVTDFYEPGSTLKPLIAAVALERGVVGFEEQIFCHQGLYVMGRRRLHDHHPFGWLSFVDIVAYSSNIGMAQLGERLGNSRLYQAVTAFGLGRPTGIELPGEVGGRLLPLSKWTSYSTGSIPMGQEIATTPIQMVTAFCALASEGRLLKPTLIRGVADSQGRTIQDLSQPTVRGHPISASVARQMIDPVLAKVVDDGTGKRAQLKHWRVFGKTGTAQKRASDGPGYSHNLHVSSFVGGAPVDRPRLVCVLLINEPSVPGHHYGGTLAAPGVAKILERSLSYLHVPPDRVEVAKADGSKGKSRQRREENL